MKLIYNTLFISSLVIPLISYAEQPPLLSSEELQGDVEKLETLIIEGESTLESFEMTNSISNINREQMERRQSSNVMEVLQDLPGVSIEGGPRAGGMKINIRGFDSNEDVLIKIDGATQNFEKYRYGIGLSIDPELLKRVEVSRGAASMTHGSGALGGVIEMETIDARDLLDAGEMIGIKAKYSHRFNNDADNLAITAMASPLDFLDILVSGVKRSSNNYKLPDGSRYPDSEESQVSGLAKIELYNDFAESSFAFRFSNESGPEPFDATSGVASVGDTVQRTSEEKSYTFNSRIQPESELLDLKVSVGFTNKMITDGNSVIAGRLDDTGTNGTDIFQYNIWTGELKNQANFELLGVQNSLTFGAQFNQEVRNSTRINILGTSTNPSQPPGKKESYGIFLQHQIFIGDFTLGAGVRGDYYEISSAATSKQALQAQGRAETADFYHIKPSFSLDYNILGGPFTLFYSYFEAFRAPLIDEYFSTTTTRCKTFSMFSTEPNRISPRDYPGGRHGAAFIAAKAQYNIAKANYENSPYADKNAICGDLYEPEQSYNHEIGISFIYDGVFDDSDRFSSKLTYFYTQVDHILESMYQDSLTGKISQPGEEVHQGFELELSYDSDSYFGSLSLSTLDGYRNLNYFNNNSNQDIANVTTLADQGEQDLVDSPADKLIFTLGRKFNQYNFEIGYRLEAFNDRLVTTGTETGCSGGIFIVPSCNITGEQKGYVLHDLFATWRPWKRTELRLNVDNILNTEYSLAGFGGGEGTTAQGMDIRLSFSQQF